MDGTIRICLVVIYGIKISKLIFI